MPKPLEPVLDHCPRTTGCVRPPRHPGRCLVPKPPEPPPTRCLRNPLCIRQPRHPGLCATRPSRRSAHQHQIAVPARVSASGVVVNGGGAPAAPVAPAPPVTPAQPVIPAQSVAPAPHVAPAPPVASAPPVAAVLSTNGGQTFTSVGSAFPVVSSAVPRPSSSATSTAGSGVAACPPAPLLAADGGGLGNDQTTPSFLAPEPLAALLHHDIDD